MYRNYGSHGTGAALRITKICDHNLHDVWSIVFDFEPRHQFKNFGHILSSSGTSCPTSANWGRHSEIVYSSFRSNFRDLSEITVKCSSDGQ